MAEQSDTTNPSTLNDSEALRHLVDNADYLCGRHAKFGEFQIGVMDVPQDRRRQEHIRYSYVVKLGGQWQPLG